MQLWNISVGHFVLSTIYAKFANIDNCIAEQMGNFFMAKIVFCVQISQAIAIEKSMILMNI